MHEIVHTATISAIIITVECTHTTRATDVKEDTDLRFQCWKIAHHKILDLSPRSVKIWGFALA